MLTFAPLRLVSVSAGGTVDEIVAPSAVVPPVAVAVKVTDLSMSETSIAATTVSAPATPSVNLVEARPLTSVVSVVVLSDPPPAVTEKATGTPAKATSFVSRTSTMSGADRREPAVPVCSSPEIFTKLAKVRAW